MMLVVLFKDWATDEDKMLKATLFIQRSRGGSKTDDIVKIYDAPWTRDLYRVVYSTPELKKHAHFYMDHRLVLDYISDTLKSLTYDVDPFEYVQLSTAIHPSVLYHVSDLDKTHVRHLVEDILCMTLKTNITMAKN